MEPARQKDVAKWGAACQPCSAAKAKCIRSNEVPDSKCDRCERLFKDCSNQVHRPRKKRTTKPSFDAQSRLAHAQIPTAKHIAQGSVCTKNDEQTRSSAFFNERVADRPNSKTAQLEQKLNGLVDLLRASGEIPALDLPGGLTWESVQSIDAITACIPTDQDPDVSIQQRPSSSTAADSACSCSPQDAPTSVPSSYNSFAPPTCICRAAPGSLVAPPDSDEVLLERFRTEMTSVFPFIVIPPGTTVPEMEQQKPFLFSTIRMVTSMSNVRSMQTQMYAIMYHISHYMLLRSERSLDLLQGLVVVLAWYHHHCLMHSQMNNLVHLAESLLADLGLNRHPKLVDRPKLMVLNPGTQQSRTNEERRAMLAVWYLASCISTGYQKIQSFSYTTYAQQCAKELEEDKEYGTDLLLVYLIRVQHITEKIFHFNNKSDSEDEVSSIPRAPQSAYQAAFQTELNKIKSAMPKSVRSNKFLLAHIHTATIHLYEPPLINNTNLSKISAALTLTSPVQPSILDICYRSSSALRSWCDHWLTIPATNYHYLPVPIITQLINFVTMVSRWARLVGSRKNVGPEQIIQVTEGSSQSTTTDTLTARRSTTRSPSPSPLANLRIHDAADPDIPAAVRSLREQLLTQPALSLDIPAILAAVGARLEQAHIELQAMSAGQKCTTIWDIGFKKVMITRAKLERWAEVVAAGGAEAFLTAVGKGDPDSEGSGEEDEDEHGAEGMDGVVDDSPVLVENDVECVPEGWQWGNDLFDGLDPNLWFDNGQDWGTGGMDMFSQH